MISSKKLKIIEEEIVTRRIKIYEVFCEEGQQIIPIIKPEKSIIETIISPVKLPDRFTKDMEEILKCINNLKENFRDPMLRQVYFVELKNKLTNLRNKLTLAQSNFLRSINMCIDSLENTRAELLNEKQIETFESVLCKIHETIDDFEVDLLQQILIKSGLKPIPSLEGISEFYQ